MKRLQKLQEHFNIKWILSGIVFAIFSATIVFAFVIDTNVENAIQYMQQSIYTSDWTNNSTPLIHIWEWDNLDNIYLQWDVKANQYCDTNWEHCKQPQYIVSANWIYNQSIPMIIDNNLQQTNLYYSWNTFLVWVSNPNVANALIIKPDLFVWWTSYFDKELTWNDIYSLNYFYSQSWYCDINWNCNQITDFYTKSYITWHYYDKIFINNNYYTTWQSDARYITWWELATILLNYYTTWQADALFVTGWELTTILQDYYTTWQSDARYIQSESDPIRSADSWNYYTKTEANSTFQEDIASTNCTYWIESIDDDWSINCAANNDTNDYVNNISFDTSNWNLVLTRNDGTNITTNLDWRYLTQTNTILKNSTSASSWWACSNAWQIIYDSNNWNFLWCNWSIRLKLNN